MSFSTAAGSTALVGHIVALVTAAHTLEQAVRRQVVAASGAVDRNLARAVHSSVVAALAAAGCTLAQADHRQAVALATVGHTPE